jgi:threonine synthase
MSVTRAASWPGLIHHYRRHLSVSEDTPVITLLEGNTPLLRCERLQRHIGMSCELHVKFEGMNPTASFKDRGMTMAISKAVEKGAKAVLCASTGNTSASAAAYAARAGIKAFVVVPHGNIAKGKLSQAVMHGARVLSIEGSFDQALRLVRSAAERYPVTLVNSINPDRIEGQKTAAFEVCDQLGRAPTYHFLPVGNAGNITAYWRGYCEYERLGIVSERPKMMGFEASGAAPIVRGYAIERPETVATAIRIGNPASWEQAVRARDESGGAIEEVNDVDILAAYQLLGRLEGIFCEPASAASVAGVIKHAARATFCPGDAVVCTLTGHGLKDPDTALRQVGEPTKVPPSLDKLAEFLELK